MNALTEFMNTPDRLMGFYHWAAILIVLALIQAVGVFVARIILRHKYSEPELYSVLAMVNLFCNLLILISF